MIRFLDLDTKRFFNGSRPYVFNMGDGESVGKWVTKNVIFISNEKTLTCSFPDDSLFWIAAEGLDSHGLMNTIDDWEKTVVNGHEYYDIESVKTHSIELVPYARFAVQGDTEIYGLYKLSVIFMGGAAGEFHDNMVLAGRSSSEEFEFAADIYDTDERLPQDLSNLGVEIPRQFQRAVYDSNVRDESDDHTLLNRKFKELLIEYWNVIANKGSHESLVNSLKFFEYGDLVKLYEYWKYVDNFSDERLVGRDMEQIMSKDILEHLDSLAKTTYISIGMLVNGVTDGEYVTMPEGTLDTDPDKFIPEPVPEIRDIPLKWTLEDLSLKMTLLANYMSTYFMPIHLDLIHSSIDKIVFTNCVKILRGAMLGRESFWDDTMPIECNLSYENMFWLGDVTAYNYEDTVLRDDTVPIDWGDGKYIGVDPIVDDRITFSEWNIDNVKIYLNQYFGGVGAIVPVVCKFDNRYFTKSTLISIYKKEDESNYSLVNEYTSYENIYDGSQTFNLVFTRAGEYLIQLQISLPDGSSRAGSWYVTVNGGIGNKISMKRLRKIDYSCVDSRDEFDDWFYSNLDFNSFMFTEPMAGQIKYKQWLVPTDGYEIDGIGLNHLLVLECGHLGTERPIRLKTDRDQDYTQFYFDLDIAERLSEAYPHYWWRLLERNTARRTSDGMEITNDSRYYIVGVRKYFDNDGDTTREVFSDRVVIYENGDIEDIDIVLVSRSRSGNSRGFLEITAPEGSEITIDGSSHYTTVTRTTTIPVRKERSKVRIEYRIGGHLFEKEFTVDSMIQELGSPDYAVHCQRKAGYTTIEESRFFPIFHRLEPVVDGKVSRKDTVVCIPDFRWVDKDVESTRWEFVNATTGEIFYSKSFREYTDSGDPLYIQEPFVSKFDYKNHLTKGYYDIVMHFTMGGVEQTETVLSAFRIE